MLAIAILNLSLFYCFFPCIQLDAKIKVDVVLSETASTSEPFIPPPPTKKKKGLVNYEPNPLCIVQIC